MLGLRDVVVILAIGLVAADAPTSFVATEGPRLRILGVFGHLGKSHFLVFKPLVEELARRGHHVTVLSHFPRSNATKLEEPLPTYRDISLVDEDVGVFVDVVDLNKLDHSPFRFLTEQLQLSVMAKLACEKSLAKPQVREFLKSDEKFDVVITEFFNTDCFLGFVHKFKAPYVALSSHQIMPWASQAMNDPEDPSYVPNVFMGFKRPLGFFERVLNLLSLPFLKIAYANFFQSRTRGIAEETFGKDLPDLADIAKNASVLMLNTHHSIHGARPHVPNVVEVGGLHISSKIKSLPKDIQKFLDEATEGVLYFNWGSMIKTSTMTSDKLEHILSVLESIPRRVIWKWESDNLPRKPKNVLVKKWLPQFEILNHPNVRCYMGHGGLLGLSEGVYAGVPMILVPMFGDQPHNVRAIEARGAAIVVEYGQLDRRTFRHALDEIFNNTRYRENAKKVSAAFRDRLRSPLETAVWWTEHVGRGQSSRYLRNDGVDMPFHQRYLLDVAFFLVVAVILVAHLTRRAVKTLFGEKVKKLKEH